MMPSSFRIALKNDSLDLFFLKTLGGTAKSVDPDQTDLGLCCLPWHCFPQLKITIIISNLSGRITNNLMSQPFLFG